MGKGGFGRWGLAFVLLCFFIDDAGTAIGFQAEEEPFNLYEANVLINADIQDMIRRGWVTTETGGMRIIWMNNSLMVLLLHFMNWNTSFTRLWLYLAAVTKVAAGYMWWGLEPNYFTVTDFLTFKPGRATPKRCPTEIGSRRLMEGGSREPAAWSILHILFPII